MRNKLHLKIYYSQMKISIQDYLKQKMVNYYLMIKRCRQMLKNRFAMN
nr:MAG TPA: hypothetical protein [Caudoviricetes sp.]